MTTLSRISFFFLLTILVIGWVNSQPLPPSIYSEFYSTINFTLNEAPPVPGIMYYGGNEKAYAYELYQNYGDGYYGNVTTLVQENATWYFTSEGCKPWIGTYGIGLFNWVLYAKYEGQVEFNGQLCDSWTLKNSNGFIQLYNNGSVPVYLYTRTNAVNDTSSDVVATWTFIDVTPDNVDPSIFQTPQQCYGNGSICPNGTNETMDLYYYHGYVDKSMENKNLADSLGETAYVCFEGFETNFQLITSVRVELNTSWGPYAICNFNVCDALNPLTVGREASFGVTGDSGQCSNNSVTGSWYSFTAQSNCDNPNAESCAWHEVGTLKTISADCLIGNGFFIACGVDGGLPFTSANQAFNNAFQYTDPSQGGCPDVSQTTDSQKHMKSESTNSLVSEVRSSSKSLFGALRGTSYLHQALDLINRPYF